MAKQIKCLSALLALTLFSASGFAEDYQKLAKTDLAEAQNQLLINAAQVLDKDDVTFHAWVIRGYQLALSRLDQVNTAAGYYYLLQYYLNGFADPHIRFAASNLHLLHEWPGFSVRYVDGKLLTTAVSKNRIPEGAELISCDAKTAKDLMLEYVFPYYGNPALPANWINNAPYLLIDQANPWQPKINRCEFTYQNKTFSQKLVWQPLTDSQYNNSLNAAHANTKIGLQNFSEYGLWASIPTFIPLNKPEQAVMKKMLASLAQNHNANPIVFDLRGNDGLGSVYVEDFLKTFYGKAYYNSRITNSARVTWRVTDDNFIYFQAYLLPEVAQFKGVDSALYHKLFLNMEGFQHAIAGRKLYYQEFNTEPRASSVKPQNPITGKVIVITDSYCITACLDYIDIIKQFPNVILVGQDSNADTVYRKSRAADLPSGNQIILPVSIIKHPTRLSNEYYSPCYPYSGDITNSNALMTWLSQNWQTMQACPIELHSANKVIDLL